MRVSILAMIVMAGLVCSCSTATNDNATTANTNATTNANAVAQTTPARGVPPKHDDNEFVSEAAMDGMAEVELGRLAAQKAKSPDVKKFAQRMVADHAKAIVELKQLASNKGITLPAEPNAEQKAEKDRLSKLSGAEFDSEYMSMMSAAHDKAVAAFEDESQHGSTPDVKAWATKILPTLKEHQSMAKDIFAKLP
jgi:putative membrane protein